ncbi:MAG: hypothetical protein U0Y68_23840 [Blastocatellia bacterium]
MLLLLASPLAVAQRKTPKPKFDPQKNAEEQKALAKQAQTSRDELAAATQKYKDSLEGLLTALKDRARLETEAIEKKQKLIAQGLLTVKRDLAPHERELERINSQINDTDKRITQADQFMAEVAMLEQLAKNPPKRTKRQVRITTIRATSVMLALLRGHCVVIIKSKASSKPISNVRCR